MGKKVLINIDEELVKCGMLGDGMLRTLADCKECEHYGGLQIAYEQKDKDDKPIPGTTIYDIACKLPIKRRVIRKVSFKKEETNGDS